VLDGDARQANENPVPALRPSDDLETLLPCRIITLSRLISWALSKIRNPYNLHASQYQVLTALAGLEHGTAKDVARLTAMHKTKISRVVMHLIRLELVTRSINPKDLRQAHLDLTSAGRAIYVQVDGITRRCVEQLEEAIQPADRAAFYRSLTALEGCFSASQVGPEGPTQK
jgi:DNA-binding MarR family transcriptional regulator